MSKFLVSLNDRGEMCIFENNIQEKLNPSKIDFKVFMKYKIC